MSDQEHPPIIDHIPDFGQPAEQPENLFKQVDEQLANGQPATVLVERTNGDINTAQVAGITEGRTNAFLGDITDGPKDDTPYKSIGNEFLTDKYQAHLAEKLAGVALRDAVEEDTVIKPATTAEAAPKGQNRAEELQVELKALGDQFSEQDQMNLWKYASGTMNQQEYSQDGDAGSAQGEGMKAKEGLAGLSPQARGSADKYLQLMRDLKRARDAQ